VTGRTPRGHPGWGQLDLAPGEGRARELLREALALAEEDAREVGALGYAARLFAQLALPYRDPGDVPYWERRNGTMSLRVYPGSVVDPRTGADQEAIAYPFGVMPRLLVTWMATEAVRTQERMVYFGHTLNEFLARLGLANGGGPKGPARRLRHQVERLFTCTMTLRDSRPDVLRGAAFTFADNYELWLSPLRPAEQPLWNSTITLSERFFESVVSAPVPVDLRALRALRGSPLRLDIYTWLTYRMSYLRRQTTVPWEALALQFGGDYTRLRAFKANFLKQLGAVRLVYPLADVQPTPAGLLLRRSPPHIPPQRSLQP
jgi:hypothetical protein